ncbi:DUF1642 domain-containing protein [Lactococcus petauri]|uniref:DUF1642 domain-containing protein n=1 Tax=Lactococcus petauri TaxID=1940789 RepID=UPI0038542114
MTKFELPEKPKKTNTSEDFNNLRKAVDELDKFDYAWKTHANKADRRINAANKYIEELERENQRLRVENLAVKTLVEDAKKQQPEIPEVPQFVADWYEENKDNLEIAVFSINIDASRIYVGDGSNIKNWFSSIQNKPIETIFAMKNGYTVAKEKLFYLKNKLTGRALYYQNINGEKIFNETGFESRDKYSTFNTRFTQQEIDSMAAESYEQIEVGDD